MDHANIIVSDEDNPYGTEHFMKKRSYIGWRGPIVAQAIYDVLMPGSVIDVGCALGEIAKGLLDLGVSTLGIEGSLAGREFYKLPIDKYFFADIRKPLFPQIPLFVVPIKFDLVLCFEVLSVIPEVEKYKDTILNNLTLLSDYIYMNHIDKIPGYREIPKVHEQIKEKLFAWKHKSAMKAIYNSAKFFERIK